MATDCNDFVHNKKPDKTEIFLFNVHGKIHMTPSGDIFQVHWKNCWSPSYELQEEFEGIIS